MLKTLMLVSAISWLPALGVGSPIFYISNQYSNTIVTTTAAGGTVTVFATGLSAPDGLALDALGNLYEADKGSGNIYMFTPSGVRTTIASGLSYPEGVALDSSGRVYVTEAGNGNIDRISGGVTSLFATLPANSAPSALAFDSSGNLYAAGFNSDAIYKITSSAAITTFATGLSEPQAITFNSSGVLFESDWGSGAVNEITSGGVVNSGFTGHFDIPSGIAFDSSGNLYVGDLANNFIVQFPSNGAISSAFVSTGLADPISIAYFPGTAVGTPEPSAWLEIVTGLGILALFRLRR